jgi:hypothetical protein
MQRWREALSSDAAKTAAAGGLRFALAFSPCETDLINDLTPDEKEAID